MGRVWTSGREEALPTCAGVRVGGATKPVYGDSAPGRPMRPWPRGPLPLTITPTSEMHRREACHVRTTGALILGLVPGLELPNSPLLALLLSGSLKGLGWEQPPPPNPWDRKHFQPLLALGQGLIQAHMLSGHSWIGGWYVEPPLSPSNKDSVW